MELKNEKIRFMNPFISFLLICAGFALVSPQAKMATQPNSNALGEAKTVVENSSGKPVEAISVGNANAGVGSKRVVENDAVQHAGEMNKPSPEVFGETKPIITDSQHQKSAEPVMRQFTYEDTRTGRILTFVRENEPSVGELEQLFGKEQPVSESRAPTATIPAERPIGRPIAMTDPAIKFFEKANAEADQKKVSTTDSDLRSGGFSSAPHPTGRTRPTIPDATRKAVELSMGGMLGVPTMSEVTQIYFRMLEEYDKSVNSVNESQVLSYTLATVKYLEKIIITKDNTTQTKSAKTIRVNLNAYNAITPSEKNVNFSDGSSATRSITKRIISIYNYENNLNESKRNIRLINASFVGSLELQLQSLMSK